MRILQVYKDYHPVVGGIENHIKMLSEALVQRGHQVTVLATDPTMRTHVQNIAGVHVIKAGRLATVSSAPISLRLFDWMRRLDADIVHLHFPYPIGELAYLMFGQGHPMVLSYHSDIVRQKYLLQVYRPFLYRVLARARRILVSSANYIESSTYLRPLKDKCLVIPHGTDLTRFRTTDSTARRSEEIKQQYGAPIVLFVGLLRYYKGVSCLLEAMKSINAKLLVAGEGPMGPEWRAQAEQPELDGKVFFLGRVSDAELVALYHACDLFVLPAIHRSESWGAVQVEAMACGKPVVCTELGTGTSVVNQHGETGLVVAPRDTSALAQAIQTLLSDDDLRRRMGQQAQERAHSQFSLPRMVDRLADVYTDVIRNN